MVPPSSSNASQPHKPRVKGHAPAHQNTTAWRHNPKSKTTAKILKSPIERVCRRCRAKLEWRKQYRKYKPRTVPGTCNHCRKKNVTAAYHTICETCSRTSPQTQQTLQRCVIVRTRPGEEGEEGDASDAADPEDVVVVGLCCVCAKEPALPELALHDPNAAASNLLATSSAAANRPLRLRERKAIERQAARKHQRHTGVARPAAGEHDCNESEDPDTDNNDSSDDGDDNDFDEEDEFEGEDEDEEDPFLKAVGGAEKLLVGEAYQRSKLDDEELARKLAL